MGVPAPVPDAGDVQPVEDELRARIITGLVTGVPMLALGVAAWRAWEGPLRPGDVVVFAILYVLTGLGVTAAFHRLFTHRSFKARPAVRAILAVLGSAAIEGPVISWVADHRKHHAFSDLPGDPHAYSRPRSAPVQPAVPARPARSASAPRARPGRRP